MKKPQLWQNTICEKEREKNVTKLKNSNYDKTQNLNLDKTQKLKLDKHDLNLWDKEANLNGLLLRTILHFDNPWYVLCAGFCDSCDGFIHVR